MAEGPISLVGPFPDTLTDTLIFFVSSPPRFKVAPSVALIPAKVVDSLYLEAETVTSMLGPIKLTVAPLFARRAIRLALLTVSIKTDIGVSIVVFSLHWIGSLMVWALTEVAAKIMEVIINFFFTFLLLKID